MADSSNNKADIWQPYLYGPTIRLRPIEQGDFDELFQAASDPLIWEMHPDSKRYTRQRFEDYFQSAIDSKGALVVVDLKSNQIIGSSRYTDFFKQETSIKIGFTFLERKYWGGKTNRELKTLMLNYAFQKVDAVLFSVGIKNLRSRNALKKIGGKEISQIGEGTLNQNIRDHFLYQIKKQDWFSQDRFLPFIQNGLQTKRLQLEPINKSHAQDLFNLFDERSLHVFVPFELGSFEEILDRCKRWEKRRSSDGTEIYLNWIARENLSEHAVGHFQIGIKQSGIAALGYLVGKAFQNRGFATEAVLKIFDHLQNDLGVPEVRALSDTRNVISHRLAIKVGMTQVGYIKDADFFKGSSSDEFVFSRVLKKA